MLARWWVKKYQLPSNHNLFLSRTPFDLLVELFTDKYEERPIESYRNEAGEIQFKDTGDDLIDRWEEQIAKGQIPDLMEAFDQESIQHIKKWKAAQQARDPYQAMSMKDMYDTVASQAQREGLSMGGRAQQQREQAQHALLEKLKTPTFKPGDDE